MFLDQELYFNLFKIIRINEKGIFFRFVYSYHNKLILRYIYHKMMKNTLSHVAIAVSDISSAKELFEMLSNGKASTPHPVESQNVKASFVEIGDTHIELLEPMSEDSPISKFIFKKGGGIHHLCIETENFNELIDQLVSKGIRTLGAPSIGAKNKRIVFFHPKDTFGVLIELEEK